MKEEGSAGLMGRMPRLRPIRTAEELAVVHEAARLDGNGVLRPSHMVLMGDGGLVTSSPTEGEVGSRVVGAFGIASTPLVTMWLDSEAVTRRWSFGLIQAVENLVLGNVAGHGCVLVEERSPFFPLMEEMGYRYAGTYKVFTKEA